jgi:ComEC/Rec2-related protein
MTYKQFHKIQVAILISIILLIFTNNFQLIFKTRNITELDHDFHFRIVLVKKPAKTEVDTKIAASKRPFVPSWWPKYLAIGQYIKEKQNKSLSSRRGSYDSGAIRVKRLINSLFNLCEIGVASVKGRLSLGQKRLVQRRSSFLESLEEVLEPRSVPLANGLLFGDISGISQDTYHSFKVIGILHILSASSANFTIFLQFGLLFCRPLLPFLSKKQLFYLHFALITLYFTLVGPAASTTRAFITLSLGFYASFVLCRSNLSLFHLYLAGIFISFISPNYLTALGFQFSFLASFGILLMYGCLEKEPWMAQNYFAKSLLLTFCAQFFLLPIMIYNFGEVNYIAFLANLVILPLVELLTILFLASFMALFLGELLTIDFLQRLLSIMISNLLDILFTLIELLEKIPWKIWFINEQKELYTAVFILINCGGIILLNYLKRKRYSKNKYRILV